MRAALTQIETSAGAAEPRVRQACSCDGKDRQMKALVYHGPGSKAWEDVPDPEIESPTDAIVAVETTTALDQ
ncbi:hypothetical protein GCM10022236_45690 [Microlunatus ginsengisoli]|uniref:Uncharacterized protein n=1 Tax=Microlunatus ginsengisoli TaxID=363863 RepID=A0ABP7AQC1_9ACTN